MTVGFIWLFAIGFLSLACDFCHWLSTFDIDYFAIGSTTSAIAIV